MKIYYYENEEVVKNEKSIFLAGPTPRTREFLGWRPQAIEILKNLGFDGAVYSPENVEGPSVNNIDEVFKHITEWELQHLKNATVIVFWVPRELDRMPAFTTNVEFGFHLGQKVVYGRPDNSPKNRYLDNLYTRETGKIPNNTLEETLKEAMALADKMNEQEVELTKLCPFMLEKDDIYFTSDTHFDSIRTLAYSFRPFRNVEEMNFRLVKNWNETLTRDSKIYHLGDFGNYEFVKKLNGKITLIVGNYELKDIKENFNNDKAKFKKYLLNLGFEDVIFDKNFLLDIQTKQSGKTTFILSHRPLDCKKDYFNLFGHIHEKCRAKPFGLNVGVDATNFKPIGLEEVLFVKNAILNNYDNDVYCTKDDIE